MKNSSKPFIVSALVIVISIAAFALVYISIKLQIESMIKEKIQTEQNLRAKKNFQLNLTAQYQYYTSEEYIVNAAQNELQMIKGNAPLVHFDADRQKIENIQKEIDSKYE